MNFYSDIPKFWADTVKDAFGENACIQKISFLESRKNQVSRLTIVRSGTLAATSNADGKTCMASSDSCAGALNVSASCTDDTTSKASFDVIAKFYVWGDSRYEFENLRRAYEAGVSVPKPLFCNDRVAFTEVCGGQKLPSPLDLVYCAPLGKWLRDFHERMKQGDEYIIHRDCSLGNFIANTPSQAEPAASAAQTKLDTMKDGQAAPIAIKPSQALSQTAAPIKIYGLDLEEAGPGDPLEDAAQLAACVMMGANGSGEHVYEVINGYGLDKNDTKLMKQFLEMIMADLRQRAQFRPEMRRKFRHCLSQCEKMLP